jgi:hypothetical protein
VKQCTDTPSLPTLPVIENRAHYPPSQFDFGSRSSSEKIADALVEAILPAVDVLKEPLHRQLQSSGEFPNCFQRRRESPVFNSPYSVHRKIAAFGQCFLREASLSTKQSNLLPKDSVRYIGHISSIYIPPVLLKI